MKNFFYVVYPTNQELRDILNLLKVIADDKQRTEAHITIRGPYSKKRLNSNDIKRWSSTIRNEKINITNTDNFFAYDQNTVFYKCGENLLLRKVWKKFTYNDFRPHITIYNGNNKKYSYKIFDLVAENFNPFIYEIDKLSWLEPKDFGRLQLYNLINVLNLQFLSEILGKTISKDKIKDLTKKQRLEYLKEIIAYLNQKFGSRTIATI